MRFSLRQLEAFRLFSTTLSVTRTAQMIHVSQSAVSHTLRDLETELGIKLFYRVGNRLRLTSEGKAILPAIERVFAQLTQLESEVETMQGIGAGRLTVATMPPIGTWLINGAAQRFLADRPALRFSLRNAAAPEVQNQVRMEIADIGFTVAAEEDADLRLDPLLHGEIVCVLPIGHPLAAQAVVTAGDIARERLIAPSADSTVGSLLRMGLPPGYAQRSNFLEINQSVMAVDLAARGLGVALLHPFGLLDGVDGVVLRRFAPAIPLTVHVVLPRHRPISPQIEIFLADILTVARERLSDIADDALARTLTLARPSPEASGEGTNGPRRTDVPALRLGSGPDRPALPLPDRRRAGA
ncbi:HTH-type transcriptional activator CmpR [Marinibacterium anthonyi]|nr:HTH-type transcriptional activator CmpR [Marinibacterium anthonyi]